MSIKKNTSKIFVYTIIITLTLSMGFPVIVTATTPGTIYDDTLSLEYRNMTVYVPAVGQTEQGNSGVISTITVTIQSNGSGRVFVDTLSLAQVDMQGSARLAVKVASSLVSNDENCTIDPSTFDYFFVIRTKSPIIGGPSAGGIMTATVVALLEGWEMDEHTVMTGMINPDGSIGPIGGIPYKIDAAASVGATRFLIPEGQMTYTEIVTETVPLPNGWNQYQKTVTRNVSDYAMENYGMEVIEVTDINDVLRYYTGYYFPVIASEHSISTQDYLNSMKPLATNLLDQATESYQKAQQSFDKTTIPNRFPYYYRNQVTDFLNDAEDTLQTSQDWFDNELYYTSTSYSFQSLINSQFVEYICTYYNTENQATYVNDLFSNASQLFETKSNEAKNTAINGAISLQCVGAAQKRATEAASYISSADTYIQESDYFSAIYYIARAIQRSESIGWWLGLKDYFNETNSFTTDELRDLANDYLLDAQQAIVYAGLILQEMGTSSAFLSDAQTMLDTAKNDNTNGYPAAALFEALEALSKANLALELVDATTEEKIQIRLDRANESASGSISESRLRGIEPILAVSYYEFAQSYVEENAQNALFYYKYSDLIPGVLTVTGICGTESSRFVGITQPNSPFRPFGSASSNQELFILILVSCLGGIAIGIVLGTVLSNSQEKKPSNITSWEPKSINDYAITYEPSKESYEDIPLSIEDYYKKD